MVARRLIAVLLVLLFLSSIAAALAPVQPSSEDEEPKLGPAASAQPVDQIPGKLVSETIDIGEGEQPLVRVEAGDQLQLTVNASQPGTLVVGGIGDSQDVGPLAPAHFDLLLDRGGTYPIHELDSARTVATIEVGTASRSASEPPAQPSRDSRTRPSARDRGA